jgi:hypothetical protein
MKHNEAMVKRKKMKLKRLQNGYSEKFELPEEIL